MTTAKMAQIISVNSAYTGDNYYPIEVTIKMKFATINLAKMVLNNVRNHLKNLFHYRQMVVIWE